MCDYGIAVFVLVMITYITISSDGDVRGKNIIHATNGCVMESPHSEDAIAAEGVEKTDSKPWWESRILENARLCRVQRVVFSGSLHSISP